MNSVRFALLLLIVPGVALAHPEPMSGHGFTHGLLHPVTGVDHLLALLSLGVWAGLSGGRVKFAVPAAFMLAMVGGALLGIAGVSLPAVEPLIASSVLVFGLLVAFLARVPPPLALALSVLFALGHGHAHGAEMAEAVSVVAYVTGFILACVLLVVPGVLTGDRIGRGGALIALRAAGAATGLMGAGWLATGLLAA